MKICPHCGAENPDDAEFCYQCNELLAGSGKPPRLLSQIQGLIPAEPVITSGRLRNPPLDLPRVKLGERDIPTATQANEPITAPKKRQPSKTKPGISRHAQKTEPRLTPPPPRTSPRKQLSTLTIVAGIILGLVLLGSLTNLLTPSQPFISNSAKNAYSFIEILPPSARVLLSWDYDPATQGEMELLAQPILQHLLRKRVQTVSMSLRPLGPGVATDAYSLSYRLGAKNVVAAAPPPVNFGFIPGENVALRSLTLSPVTTSSRPTQMAQATGLKQKETINAFDLIIEFSSDFANSQQWVEQVSVRSQSPLIVVASGAVAPALQPYEQTGQIRVLLSGYPDALAYEELLGQNGPAHHQATAQTLAQLALLGIIILAAFHSLLKGR